MADPAEPITRNWLVSLGVPSLVLSFGLGLMGILNFWWGVAISYLTIAWLGFDFYRSSRTTKGRWLRGIIILGLIVALSIYVFRPRPLDTELRLVGTGYTPGQVMGIDWQAEFGDVRIKLGNPTDYDYASIDAVLDVDGHSVVKVAQITSLDGVMLFPESDNPSPVIIAEGTDREGKQVRLPIIGRSVFTSRYRIRCETIPRRSELLLVAAIGVKNPMVRGKMPERVFAPFTPPKYMLLQVKYKASNKPLSLLVRDYIRLEPLLKQP